MTTGLLVAFEGLDQSGKQTQAESLRDHLTAQGRVCQLLSFPDYATPIGSEIDKALHGERDYPPDVLQLLYVANRGEKRTAIESWIAAGVVVICDRYLASSIAYGEAHGIDPVWLTEIQRFLPAPDLTILLDIAPDTAVGRKAAARDRFERDLELLARVRASYRRQAAAPGWVHLAGDRAKGDVAADVIRSVETRLALPSPR
jgi:dTMP kinase